MKITTDSVELDAILELPAGSAQGIVLFAHGSGSSRLSPRNAYVARCLRKIGMATLLFDLLTEKEALDRNNVFDMELLARRLLAATRWVKARESVRHLPLGYFGASTGAAAALIAAADSPSVRAVVSRGGRPDLAGEALGRVTAPTLLIVGGHDDLVLKLNQHAFGELRCDRLLRVVAGATHLFEEPGALEQVVELAGEWFERHLRGE